ncbi:MAG TPA: hypothetical protein VGO70_10230, partial [Arsenicitalea sp.]|nr:hypothetical protein [Arsenicitalea sp.]
MPKTPKSGAGLERNQVPLSAEITCRFQPKSGAGLLRFLQVVEASAELRPLGPVWDFSELALRKREAAHRLSSEHRHSTPGP